MKLDRYVWLMEMPQQEELKFAMMVSGAQYVMMDGMLIMPESSADNLDCLH